MSGWPTIHITASQMVALGRLVGGTFDHGGSTAQLVEPEHELGGAFMGRWEVQLAPDGDLRLRDVERDFYITPGGSIR